MHGKVPERETESQKMMESKNNDVKRMIKYISLLQRSLLSSDHVGVEIFDAASKSLSELSQAIKTKDI